MLDNLFALVASYTDAYMHTVLPHDTLAAFYDMLSFCFAKLYTLAQEYIMVLWG